MAITILPQRQSLGDILGASLGAGIQQGLQQGIQQRQQSQALSDLLGIAPQAASGLAALNPQAQAQFIKQQMQAPQQQMYAQALQSLFGPSEQPAIPEASVADLQTQQQPLSLGKESALQDESFRIPQGLSAQQAKEIAQLGLQKKKIEQQEKFHKEKLSTAERDLAHKETKEAHDAIRNEAKAAKNNLMRLERMRELLNAGKLSERGWQTAIEEGSHLMFIGPFFGMLKAFDNADTQEFRKLSFDFLKDAKEIFGSRITDTDLRTFLQTVPTLQQSNAGKRRIINNLTAFNEAALIKQKAANEIIKEHKGFRPINFQELVDERADNELNKLADAFRTGYIPKLKR